MINAKELTALIPNDRLFADTTYIKGIEAYIKAFSEGFITLQECKKEIVNVTREAIERTGLFGPDDLILYLLLKRGITNER